MRLSAENEKDYRVSGISGQREPHSSLVKFTNGISSAHGFRCKARTNSKSVVDLASNEPMPSQGTQATSTIKTSTYGLLLRCQTLLLIAVHVLNGCLFSLQAFALMP